jgi:electron transfer flavoprotein beta subunit
VRALVFLKRILDPELPAHRLHLDPQAGKVEAQDAPHVMGPYDENALETALQLKDRDPSWQLTAVSYGPPAAEDILRKALSTGADDAILVEDTSPPSDPFLVAQVLAQVVNRLGEAHLLLLGLQSGDWDSGQTAFALAAQLDHPAVSFATRVEEVTDGNAVVRRVWEGGVERVRVPLPAVLCVTNDGTNALRMAKVKDILAAKRKTIWRLPASELAMGDGRLGVVSMRRPAAVARSCTFLEGATDADKGRALAERLLAEHLV